MATLSSLVCLKDYEKAAIQNLPEDVVGYLQSGAMREQTVEENEKSFKRWYIIPRVLVDVSKCDLSTTVLGHKIQVPFGIAPTGFLKIAHPDGEIAVAKAASEIGTVLTLSTSATTRMESVSKENQLNFFQLYVYKNKALTRQLVERAENCGFKAVVVTLDVPVVGIRYADRRNNFKIPPHIKLAHFEDIEISEEEIKVHGGYLETIASFYDDTLTWEDIAWLRSITTLPIVLKGILTAQDALRGVEAGAAAIWVSNHGGRQLDGVLPTVEALPEIISAVGHKCEVYIDGGVRTGLDIFKALAIGANMVFLGRPLWWGLACEGVEGALRILSILKSELKNVMCLAGCSSVQDISGDFIARRSCSQL